MLRSRVDDLMQVVDRISVIKSKVKLEAYALSDIYAADILNLKNIRLAVSKVE